MHGPPVIVTERHPQKHVIRDWSFAMSSSFICSPRSAAPFGIVRSSAALLALAVSCEALASATQSGTVLTINTSAYATDQQIEVNVGPLPGQVQISGVIGASTTTFENVAEIIATTGPAQDFVEFRMLAATLPAPVFSFTAGNSDVKVIYEPPSNATVVTSNVSITGGVGNDKAAFEVLNGAPTFIASWEVLAGNGTNEAIAVVQSPDASDLLAIALNMRSGSGQDKFDVSVTSNAAAVDISANPFIGSGNDSAIITTLALGTGNLNLQSFGSLGNGLDVYEVTNVSNGGVASFSGFVDGGDGTDTLKFTSEASGPMNLTLSGGAGADNLDWFAKGSAVTGSPKLLGGTGNDYLKLVVDGPFAATPFIDGGSGYDIAFGFGTIVNCEEVN
jgi:hypothetical protein